MFWRILVATDGSPIATGAVDTAVGVAGLSEATLTVLAAGPEGEAAGVVEAEAKRLSDSGVEIDTIALDRDPAAAIVEAAAAGGHDLVVVGSVGMTGRRRQHALGSVPNKVSHSLACSLLIVHTA